MIYLRSGKVTRLSRINACLKVVGPKDEEKLGKPVVEVWISSSILVACPSLCSEDEVPLHLSTYLM